MKKTLIVLLIVFGTSLTYASNSENAKLELRENQNGIVQLLYTSSEAEQVTITILDDSNEIVLSEKVKNKNGFLRNYDFSKLEVGKYTFKIADNNGQLLKKAKFVKKSPVALVDLGDNRFRLIYGSKKDTPVLVVFLDKDGKTIQEDRFTSTNGFARTYIVDNDITSAQKLRLVTDLETKDFEL